MTKLSDATRSQDRTIRKFQENYQTHGFTSTIIYDELCLTYLLCFVILANDSMKKPSQLAGYVKLLLTSSLFQPLKKFNFVYVL